QPHEPHVCGEVDVEDLVPDVLELLVLLLGDIVPPGDAGVVDEVVDAAEAVCGGRHQSLQVGRFANIAFEAHGLGSAGRSQFLGLPHHGGELIGTAVGQHDMSALSGEEQGSGPAHAAGGAGDDGGGTGD